MRESTCRARPWRSSSRWSPSPCVPAATPVDQCGFVLFAEIPLDTLAVLLGPKHADSKSRRRWSIQLQLLCRDWKRRFQQPSDAEAATGIGESIPQPPPRRAPAPRTPRPPSAVAAARPRLRHHRAPVSPPKRLRCGRRFVRQRRGPPPGARPDPTTSRGCQLGKRRQRFAPADGRSGTDPEPRRPDRQCACRRSVANDRVAECGTTLPALTASAPLPAVACPSLAPPSEDIDARGRSGCKRSRTR